MDGLLNHASTACVGRDDQLLLQSSEQSRAAPQVKCKQPTSRDDALEVLRSQPSYDALIATLKVLACPEPARGRDGALSLYAPGPRNAAIVHVLVSEIVPNYWAVLQDDRCRPNSSLAGHDVQLLLGSLRSVTGLNALTAALRALVQESESGQGNGKIRGDIGLNIASYLDVLSLLLAGDDSLHTLWANSASSLGGASMKKAQWQHVMSLIAGGRIVGTAAQASAIAGGHSRWIADGAEFSKWIGRNVASWAREQPAGQEMGFCADLLHRSMSIGYAECLSRVVIDEMLLCQAASPAAFSALCLGHGHASKQMLARLLDYLSERYLNHDVADATVSAVAGLIDALASHQASLSALVVDWCTASSGAGLGQGVGIRRAVMAAIATDGEAVASVLQRSLAQFGDQLYVRHAAMLQQQVHAQILLLSAAYVARLSPIKLAMLLRSATYLNAMTNRIAATQPRARFLGIVVGEALSALADNKAARLNFDMEECKTDEAEWLKSLTTTCDSVQPYASLLCAASSSCPASSPCPASPSCPASPTTDSKPNPPRPRQVPPRAIIEVIDDDDDDDDELTPYAKDSDPEDSDQDATLVQRNKVTAPVYIRDLVAFLRDSDNYDKQKLAIETAPVLIRRKANHGTELSSHAQELATLLVGLEDKFEVDDFVHWRQRAMIALVVSLPDTMAPCFARSFFEGDYSLSQRVSILVALGLASRELAGHEESEDQSLASFASKKLPPKIEQLYLDSPQPSAASQAPSHLKALPPNALHGIATSLAASFLNPVAAEAADAASGPNILKLQTLAARYKSKARPTPRLRTVPNTTAALVANCFFFPLTAHLQQALRSPRPAVLNPALLALYLETLAIIVDAAGPSTLPLPQLTSELWDLLLRVRVHVVQDLTPLRGWLVAMSVLLDVNATHIRRLCLEHGRDLLETREWVSGVFSRIHDNGAESHLQALAASLLIKLGQTVDKFQALLMGDMATLSF
ncbi:hypothetical protein CDD81_2929 [Ophiocordyceps australis]|uniref:Telomere length regulation protein conserved domain-containing protein n=1 Tax=Ophiocordyceps australis TaxID=1399860 RepID=A0A2C5YI50_9HYPO|nr:hypothetical protein CDD81_2929 [Ophiocordyceps australis]